MVDAYDRIAIAGLGATTGYGWGLGELWKGLMSGRSAAHPVVFEHRQFARQGPHRSRSVLTMTTWEYRILSLPTFEAAKSQPGESASVDLLNRQGADGWEAVGMTVLADATVAVLLKRSSVPGAGPG